MLDEIVDSTRRRIAGLRQQADLLSERAGSADPVRPFADALSAPGLSVIAEIKRRSPSVGAIAPTLDPARLAADYEAGGAAAVSVLTEPDHFGGSTDDLALARSSCALPILLKDFVIDRVQVSAARAAGADAVLLIVALLDHNLLKSLLTEARRWEMSGLVEVHSETELERALDAGADLIGINNRDLDTFEVDTRTSLRLRPLVPSGITVVAESGIDGPETARGMAEAGFDAVLVGEAAASAPQPVEFVASLRVGR